MALTKPEYTSFAVDTTLVISIEKFCNTTEGPVSKENDEQMDFHFLVSVYPDGDEGWVEVFFMELVHFLDLRHEDDILTCIVSIIDVEGHSRFPRTFTQITDAMDFDSIKIKYLERSFILNRAEELLCNGVLNLSCDMSYICRRFYLVSEMKTLEFYKGYEETKGTKKPISAIRYMNDIYESFPNATCFHNGQPWRVFDFTFDILTLPPFHDLRKPFGVYEISDFNMSGIIGEPNLEANEDRTYVLNDVWMLDVSSFRFLLSLKRGRFIPLLKASPVINDLVKVVMKEEREKRIKLYNVDIQTFKRVFFYTSNNELVFSDFSDLVSIFELAVFLRMEKLQKDCMKEIDIFFHRLSVSRLRPDFECYI